MASRVDGVREWRAAVDALVRRMDDATQRATGQAISVIEAATKATLTTSTHPPGTPTPSAPGEPPSLVSGALRRSVTGRGPVGDGPHRWVGQVGPTIVYARIQELGGRTGAHHRTILPPRPYLKPTVAANTRRVGELYRRAWSDAYPG